LLLTIAETETLTLKHWKVAAIKSGITEKQYEKFNNRFIADPNFKKHILVAIQKYHHLP
jgi:hypothetical protein